MGALYRLDFPNGKSYVGITLKTSEERFAAHARNMRRKDKQRLAVTKALAKYGVGNVVLVKLAESNDWNELCRLEIKAIQQEGSLSPAGYNLTSGGDGAPDVKFSGAARARMAKSARAAWAMPGYREQMASQRTGKKQSEQTKERRAASVAAAWKRPGYREALSQKQKAQSPATRMARSESAKAAWADPEKRAAMLAARTPKGAPAHLCSMNQEHV